MQALVYLGPAKKALEERPKPEITAPTDAIVRITKTTICGTRLVDTVSTPMLLNTVRSHKIDPKCLITHRFKLERILDAYEAFAHAADTRALKVIIEA